MGMFLRRGPAEKPVHGIQVTISGDMDSAYAYVTIDGTKYTEPGTYAIPAGASITVYCYNAYTISLSGYKSTIKFNGTLVAQASSQNQMINYSFQLETQTSIVFSTKALQSLNNYHCAITTS